MSVPTLLIIVGLVLALIAQFQAQAPTLVGWAVVFVCVGLLWGNLG